MQYKTKVQLLAAFLVLNLIVQDVAALKCKGRPNLVQGSGMSVVQTLDDPDIDYSYSAILEERQRSNPTCTAAEDCTEINIKLADGQFAGGKDMIWTFSSCFQETMNVKICSDEPEIPTTTTTTTTTTMTTTPEMVSTTIVPTTTMASTTTVVSTTSAGSTTGAGSTSMDTTTDASTTGTTSDAPSTSTASASTSTASTATTSTASTATTSTASTSTASTTTVPTTSTATTSTATTSTEKSTSTATTSTATTSTATTSTATTSTATTSTPPTTSTASTSTGTTESTSTATSTTGAPSTSDATTSVGTTSDAATTTDMSTSAAPSTSQAAMSTTTAGDTTTDMSTSESPMTTEALPDFDGCYEGTVTFANATCMPQQVMVNLTNSDDNTTAVFIIQVVGCCDTAECRATDGATRDNTCWYGEGASNDVEADCDTYCYAYLNIDSSDDITIMRGCLSDLDLSDTPFSDTTSCSSSIQDGSCIDANSEESCFRCCTGNKCNGAYIAKGGFLDSDDGEGGGASAIIPSLLLMLAAFLFTGQN